MIAVAVNVLLVEPIRNTVSPDTGSPVSTLVTPKPRTYSRPRYLTVVRERKIRGTTERTLSLDQTKVGRIDERKARAMTADQHRQAFLMMLTRLAADFDRAVDSGDLQPRLDQLGYSQLALYLSPDDMAAFRAGFTKLVEPYLAESPGKDRIVLSTFSLPDS
jgi:hypothetical protein